MTDTAIAVIAIAATVNVGMLVNAIPEWIRARADARLARQPAIAGYDIDVVRLAVRGALLSVGADEDNVDRISDLVRDELETNGAVFDGHEWRPVA